MKIGYARTSTIDQVAGFEAQLDRLQQEACDKVFREQVSAMGERPELDRAIDYARDGDVLIVTKLDRLARSVTDLNVIVKRLGAKGATLKVLDSPIDLTSPFGELIFNILGAIAQFEREIMLTRQREGIAAAKAEGKYRGRKPTVQLQREEILRLHREGISNAEIARQLSVHRSNVGRVLGAAILAAADTEAAAGE
jgi:DNA invertase Pin-like site-specific DNA recombinase